MEIRQKFRYLQIEHRFLRMKVWIPAVAALAAGLMITFSCKKDNGTVTANYLEGSVRFTLPAYVAAGDVLSVTPSGISHPDGDPFGYYWTVATLKTARDTSKYALPDGGDGHFSYTVPDTIGRFSVTVTAFAEDYYPSSGSVSFVILHPENSLTETGIEEADPRFTDARDGARYAYVHIGGLDWMRENLRYAGAGGSYDGCEAADPVFGRYYSYEQAQTACPDGWRLPTDAEWAALVSEAAGTAVAAGDAFPTGSGSLMSKGLLNTEKMWEYWPEVSITDAVGFCALPVGYGSFRETAGSSYEPYGSFAAFWTADAAEAGRAYYRYFNVRRPEVYLGSGDTQSLALSVRCVK